MIRSAFKPSERFLVPDLSPSDRIQLKKMKPRMIFVAESPHINEVEPDELEQRRPLCGAAGKKWWGLLSELLEGERTSDLSLKYFLSFCQNHGIVMMNAVQYPLDPKIAQVFPGADPVENLGFGKLTGVYSYKKQKSQECVQSALKRLSERLTHPSVAHLPIYCLGNDAEWFVERALSESEYARRVGEKIPHPSAWWRRGGYFGEVAQERLTQIFKSSRRTV